MNSSAIIKTLNAEQITQFTEQVRSTYGEYKFTETYIASMKTGELTETASVALAYEIAGYNPSNAQARIRISVLEQVTGKLTAIASAIKFSSVVS